MTAALVAIGRFLWSLANICLPIPLGLIAAVGLWLWLDRSSAIREAVDDALTEAVAGAKIAALEATLAERNRQLQAGLRAAEGFADLLREAQLREAQQAAIDATEDADYEAKLKAAGRSCAITPDDLRWLRQ